MKARVIILVHDTSSHHALYVYQVSLKFLLRFSSYRVDTKLYGQIIKGKLLQRYASKGYGSLARQVISSCFISVPSFIEITLMIFEL